MRAREATKQHTQEMAKNFLQEIENWAEGEDILKYAKAEERGDYLGFAALHDKTDPNQIMADVMEAYGFSLFLEDEEDEDSEETCGLFNRVVDEVNILLVGRIVVPAHLKEGKTADGA